MQSKKKKIQASKQHCVRVLLSYSGAFLESDIMHATEVVHKQRNLAIEYLNYNSRKLKIRL